MKIGSTVTLIYEGRLEDGSVFGFATKDNPMKFQTGMDMVIDGLEEGILEMNEVGEKKTIVVNEYKAYGEYLDDFTQTIPAEQIPVNDLKPGKRIWLSNSENGAPMPVTIIDVEGDMVRFDMNHPLAGHELTFDVEILDIEDAPENFVSAREKAEHMKEQAKLLGGDQADGFR